MNNSSLHLQSMLLFFKYIKSFYEKFKKHLIKLQRISDNEIGKKEYEK